MSFYVLFHSIFLVLAVYSSSFAVVSPWGGGTMYNPMGNPGGPILGPVAPPYYNPGPGGLAPSFSYTQQPSFAPNQQQSFKSGLSTDAKNVIGKWTLRVDQFRGSPGKITDTSDQINKDRQILNDALKAPGLTSDDLNSAGKINLLLDLAEVRALAAQVSKAQSSFPDTYRNIIGDKKTTDPKSKPQKKEWYITKRDRLRTLLQEFQQFLNRNPQYTQNPPDLLVGLMSSLTEGSDALDKYNQFCNCLTSANLPYCKTLAQPSQKTSKQQSQDPYNRGFNSNSGGDDEEYDDREDDNI